MFSYKLDFNSCAIRDSFCKCSHNCSTHVYNYYFGNVIEDEATYVHITLVNFVALMTETGTPAESVAILLFSISPLTTTAAL